MLTVFSAESEKNLWVGNFLNLKLNTRLTTKKIRKLDVDAFREEGKRLKSQIHLIIISRDCWGPTGSNITGCHQQNLSSKIKAYNTKLPDMLPLSPRICQCMRQFSVKRPKLLSATSNLRVEQNLVHLGRFKADFFSQLKSLADNFFNRNSAPKPWLRLSLDWFLLKKYGCE